MSAQDFIKLELDIQSELISRAPKDFLAFVLACKDDYVVNWHHKRLARKLNEFVFGDLQYLMVFMPPRHGKTEQVSKHLPAFIHGNFPNDRIMAASYSDALAIENTLAIQKIIDSAEFKSIFPNVEIPRYATNYTDGKRNSYEYNILGHSGGYKGQGVGGQFTGFGGNWILIDDPIKGREVADSVAFRKKLWDFYENDLFSRLESDLKTGKQGKILVTLTRWHEDDLAGRILEKAKEDPNAPQFEVISYPMERIDMDDPTDPREIGEPLWPQKYGKKKMAEFKSLGQRSWSSLYQQSPTVLDGEFFKASMFEFNSIPSEIDFTFTMSDTAYTDKQTSDYTVISTWGMKAGQLYLIDCYRKQVKAEQLETIIINLLKKYATGWGYRGTYIEPKGHGIYLNQKLKESGILIPGEKTIKEFFKDRRIGKVERANNAIPHLATRKIIINNQIQQKESLVSEALGFPNSKHDDFVDTLVDAIKFAYGSPKTIFDLL